MLPSFANLPEHLRSVIEPLCMEAEQRGYARGKADGQTELLCGIKAVQQLVSPMPPAMPLSMTAAMPVNLSQPAPQPSEFEQATDGDDSEGEDFDFDAILDGLFDGQWSDAEKQEILGIAIVAVREAADAQGVDPEPFVDRLKALAGNPQAAERVMMGHPVWLAWVPERIDNPRGKYQYRARDTDTGRVVYGAEAERKLRKDHAGGEGVPSADDVTKENKEYLEARTKARENVDAVTQKLAQGQMLKKPEWDEFHDQLSYLTGQQLKEVRKTMMDRLAAKVKGGKRKGDRIGNLQSAIKSVVQFGVTRSFQEDYDKLSLARVVERYGGIDPSDHEFQRHFGSASEAREYGVATKKGGKSLDDLAKNLISAGHLVVPEGMDETQALADALQGKKQSASADDGDFWDAQYRQHAAKQELDAMDDTAEPAPAEMGDMDAAGVGNGDASFDFGANAAEPELEVPAEPVAEEPPMAAPEPAEVTVEAGDEQPAAETDGKDQSRAAIDARLAESGLPTGLSDDVLKQIPLDENRGFDDDGNPTYYKSKAPAETRAYIANLTPDEVKAVGQYAGSMNFGDINTLLRGGVDDPTSDSKHGQIIKNLDAVFDKAPELKTPIKTYRGINIPPDTLKNWLDEVQSASSAGRPFEDMAFFSTSTDQSAVSGYGNVGMEITARHGIDASPLSNAQSENEFLLPRGSKFRIIGVENHDGRPVIKLDQIVQRDAESTATQPEQPTTVDTAPEPVVEATDATVDALPIGNEPTPDAAPTEPAPTVAEPEATAEPEPTPVAPPKLTPQQVAARDKAMDDAVKAAQRKAPGGRLTPEQRSKVRADAKSKYESSLGQPAPQAEARPVSAADAERDQRVKMESSRFIPKEGAFGTRNNFDPETKEPFKDRVQAADGKWYLMDEVDDVKPEESANANPEKKKDGLRYGDDNAEVKAQSALQDAVDAGDDIDADTYAVIAQMTGTSVARVKEMHEDLVSTVAEDKVRELLSGGGKLDADAKKRLAAELKVTPAKVTAAHARVKEQDAFIDLQDMKASDSINPAGLKAVAKKHGLTEDKVRQLLGQLDNSAQLGDPDNDPAPTKKGKAEPAPKAPAKSKANGDTTAGPAQKTAKPSAKVVKNAFDNVMARKNDADGVASVLSKLSDAERQAVADKMGVPFGSADEMAKAYSDTSPNSSSDGLSITPQKEGAKELPKTPQAKRDAIKDAFHELLSEQHTTGRIVPIGDIQKEMRQRYGEDAVSPENFENILKKMDLDGTIRLVEHDNPNELSPSEKMFGIQSRTGLLYYVKQPANGQTADIDGDVSHIRYERGKKKSDAFFSSDEAPTRDQYATSVMDSFHSLLAESHAKHGYDGGKIVEIPDLREAIRRQYGDTAASHGVFDTMLSEMAKNGQIRTVPIDDRSQSTPERLKQGMSDGGGLSMYVKLPTDSTAPVADTKPVTPPTPAKPEPKAPAPTPTQPSEPAKPTAEPVKPLSEMTEEELEAELKRRKGSKAKAAPKAKTTELPAKHVPLRDETKALAKKATDDPDSVSDEEIEKMLADVENAGMSDAELKQFALDVTGVKEATKRKAILAIRGKLTAAKRILEGRKS
jgi:hypothetical protein